MSQLIKIVFPQTLYIVATPIGHLEDISLRALEVLRQVDVIAAEDTRHSEKLLKHYNITTPLMSYHDHNADQKTGFVIEKLRQNQTVALISDAGTPLISDPGFQLVQAAVANGFKIVPIPGPSALVTALSISGLPCSRFAFEGFLPVKAKAREEYLLALRDDPHTLIFYEAPHRILDVLASLKKVFGGERRAVIARELTKLFETVLRGSLEELCQQVEQDHHQRQGEFVVLVAGASEQRVSSESLSLKLESILQPLLAELPLKQAVQLVEKMTGVRKNVVYELALELQKGSSA